jgi:glucose-1-phosphate thymidylyltransferase
MKGVILAGGTGTRLRPMTLVTNKHLLPVYDRPMIYFPIHTLVSGGIEDILIITGKEHMGDMVETLGSGKEFGCNFTYKVQEDAGGIAQALLLAEDFADREPIAVILGDNIFENTFDFNLFESGAWLLLKEVPDAQRFGVVQFNTYEKIERIIEKPSIPPSSYAVTGLYLYDYLVFDYIRLCTPSGRGELEITDVNNLYLRDNNLGYQIIGGFWSDAGTPDSLYRASQFAKEAKCAS